MGSQKIPRAIPIISSELFHRWTNDLPYKMYGYDKAAEIFQVLNMQLRLRLSRHRSKNPKKILTPDIEVRNLSLPEVYAVLTKPHPWNVTLSL